jgi:putative ABC transport system permease protein
VVIVDEKIADRYWPDGNPVGKRLKLGDHASENPWIEVIGVVGHVKFRGVHNEARWQLYLPQTQGFCTFRYQVVVKTTGDPMALAGPIRQAVTALDPELPVASFQTMEEYVGSTTEQSRLLAGLLGLFATTALLMAGVGLYGVMSSVTAERKREIAIRMAIGARGRQVVGMVLRQGLTSVFAGATLGLAASTILSRLAESLLFKITHLDLVTYFGAVLFLFVVALVACILPARRATSVDPTAELRSE